MTDPRIARLAQQMQDMAHEGPEAEPSWEQLGPKSRAVRLMQAEEWLNAAVAAGIVPPAERPTPDHDAIWLDEEGFIYSEYQTSPPTPLADAAILRLVTVSEACSSKREMEDKGAEFRLIGWSK